MVDLDALALGAAIRTAAGSVRLEVAPDGHQPVALRWGAQVDTRPITLGAGRDDQRGDVHPEMVAAYLAKYLTKSTEDFCLDGHGRVHFATDARYLGASEHAVRIIETAEYLARHGGEDYARPADRYGTLGYRVTCSPRPAATPPPSAPSARPAATGTNNPRAARHDPDSVRQLDADDDPAGDDADIVVNATGATSAPATSTPMPRPGR